ncbi:cingulin-like [Lethenteron reissneri]|uniref:cingulin-like n=1 Tax=Lethenteron reissneri TaxID=7753 RepID=UPI002AB64F42|nr:cingulin-like [Lethenteron reissneri]
MQEEEDDAKINSIMSSALVQRSTGDTGVLVYTHAVIKHRPRPTGETPFKVPPRAAPSDWQLKENKAMSQQRRQLQATEAAMEAQRAPAGASRPSTSHAADVLRTEIIRLSERVAALEGELRQAHNALKQAEKAEKSLVTEKVSLHKELEDTQGALERLSEGRLGVEGRLREAERAAATLRRDKEELEQRGRQQQHAIERLHRELQAARQEVSRASGSAELAGSRGGSGDGPGSEMERALQQKSRLQEMVENLTVELEDQTAERETLALQTRRLERRVGELEAELETAMAERDATFKQHKQLEDRNKELQMEYAEQCENLDLMMKKVNRLREQKDELRAELEQKCVDIESLKNDNAALERQNDDLRGRVSELESLGSRDQGALLSELEGRLRSLEVHLEATEREKERLQAEGRRLEENVVGVTRRLESERTQTNSEREQVKQQLWSLRQQGEEKRAAAGARVGHEQTAAARAEQAALRQRGTPRRARRAAERSAPTGSRADDAVGAAAPLVTFPVGGYRRPVRKRRLRPSGCRLLIRQQSSGREGGWGRREVNTYDGCILYNSSFAG